MIDLSHGLVKLTKAVNWDRMDEVFGETFSPDQGRPAISTRLMVSLHYLKYTHNLSDNDVVSTCVGKSVLAIFERNEVFRTRPAHPSFQHDALAKANG